MGSCGFDRWMAERMAGREENPQTDSRTDSPTDSVLTPLARLVALLCVLSVCLSVSSPRVPHSLTHCCVGPWRVRVGGGLGAHTSASSEGPTVVPPCTPPAIDCEAASLSACLSSWYMYVCVCVCVYVCVCAGATSDCANVFVACLSASLPACVAACVVCVPVRGCVLLGVLVCVGVCKPWCCLFSAVAVLHCVACHRVSMMCKCVSVSVCLRV